VAYIVLTHFV